MAAIRVEAWRDSYATILPPELLDRLSAERDTPRFAKWLLEPGIAGFVAEDSNGVLGFCILAPSDDDDAPPGTGEVTLLYLRAAARGKGIGRRLLERAMEECRRRRYAELRLWVLRDNAAARRFYESMGLRPDGAEKTRSGLTEVRYGVRVRGTGDFQRP